MQKKKLSRRDFLNISAGAAAGSVLAACGAQPTPETIVETVIVEKEGETIVETVVVEKEVVKEVEKEVVVTATPPPVEEVTMEVVHGLPEYDNAYRQLFDVYEAENPGIKLNVTVINEDTTAAYLAKVAGGFLSQMEQIPGDANAMINKENYQEWIDLSTIDFPWWDRWQYDVRNAWSDRYQLPGPRSLGIFEGIIASFIYHKDIMDDIGWDPQRDVKALDDFGRMMDEVNAYVDVDETLEFGWDRGWINGFTYLRYMNMVPVAYPDGTRERQYDCWLGNAKFNAEDSPYRHTFEFSREALEKGWNSDGWWNREWEADQEAAFTAKKSVMVLHGPWMWDKALANDPSLELLGFPLPSVDGEETILHMEAPKIDGADSAYGIRVGNEDLDIWAQTQELFAWWHSPEIVKARAEIEGKNVLYDLDESLVLESPQYLGLVQYVGKDFFSHVKMDDGPWGRDNAQAYKVEGASGVWDLGTGSYNDTFVAAITGEISVQEALDVAQANWEKSFDGLPLG